MGYKVWNTNRKLSYLCKTMSILPQSMWCSWGVHVSVLWFLLPLQVPADVK